MMNAIRTAAVVLLTAPLLSVSAWEVAPPPPRTASDMPPIRLTLSTSPAATLPVSPSRCRFW